MKRRNPNKHSLRIHNLRHGMATKFGVSYIHGAIAHLTTIVHKHTFMPNDIFSIIDKDTRLTINSQLDSETSHFPGRAHAHASNSVPVASSFVARYEEYTTLRHAKLVWFSILLYNIMVSTNWLIWYIG